MAFSDALSELEGELLEKSYVSTPERMKFDQRIDMHLRRKVSLFSSQPPRPMKAAENSVMVEKLTSSLKRARPLAIIVLGSVGTGKTTFLEYTHKVKAASFFQQSKNTPYPHWIYVDFRAFTQGESSKIFIFEKIFEYIKKDTFFSTFDKAIEPAYRAEIDTLKRGPLFLYAKDEEKLKEKIVDIIASDFKSIEPYVKKLVQNATKHTPIFLVIDNIDQVEAESN